MKYYLTKEWFYDIICPLNLKKRLKVVESAEEADENSYQQLYKKELDGFMKKEKERLTPPEWTTVPWLNKALASIGVSKRNIKALKEFLEKDGNFFHQKPVQFDEEAIKRKFDTDLSNKIETCQKFPAEILNEVKDLRVFALGYVTEQVKKMAEVYLEKKDKQNLELMRASYNQTNIAETSLRKNIRFGNYLLKIVSDIQKKGNRVYIEFVGLPTLVIKKAEIIEWESICYKEQDGFYPAKLKPIATTIAKAVEVVREEDKYELHFLMCNESSEGKRLLWNFTVSGSDIDSEGEYVFPL
ncbi:MAG: DUF4085 family protein [Clostridia bacterium]|nr:DUF4085 family protein [Clostridia bacterium]